jgi:hypothetical protein
MGDGLVGLVHPCKIYNILRVGAACVYIGPHRSSISEILSESAEVGRVRHGDSNGLVCCIERIRALPKRGARSDFSAAAKFSKQVLLPRLIAKLENVGGHKSWEGRRYLAPSGSCIPRQSTPAD